MAILSPVTHKVIMVVRFCTKVPFLCRISLHIYLFSLHKNKKHMHEHASRHWHAEDVKMRSRRCTEHRHTKIIRYSPWCEVSGVPRAWKPVCPPTLHTRWAAQLAGNVENRRSTKKPLTLYKLTMTSLKQCLRDVWSVCMRLVLLHELSDSITFFTNYYAKCHSTMFHRWYTPTRLHCTKLS